MDNSNIREKYSNRFDFPLFDPDKLNFYGFNNTRQYGNTRFGENSRQVIKKWIEKELEPVKKIIKNYKNNFYN